MVSIDRRAPYTKVISVFYHIWCLLMLSNCSGHLGASPNTTPPHNYPSTTSMCSFEPVSCSLWWYYIHSTYMNRHAPSPCLMHSLFDACFTPSRSRPRTYDHDVLLRASFKLYLTPAHHLHQYSASQMCAVPSATSSAITDITTH